MGGRHLTLMVMMVMMIGMTRKALQDLLIKGVMGGLTERRELMELAETVGATTNQFRAALQAIVDDRRISRGKRPSRVKNRAFAYTYHPPVKVENVSEDELMARASAKIAELTGGK